jgi:hypothetical protein
MNGAKRRSWNRRLALAWVWLAGSLLGCAGGGSAVLRDRPSRPDMGWDAAGTPPPGTPASSSRASARSSRFFGLFGEKADDFQVLQKSAGLEEDSQHPAGKTLEVDDAKGLWETLARTPTTLKNFAPRRTLILVLRQVLAAGEDVSYSELLQRLGSFHFMVVMRPDGHLAGAIGGQPSQRMGRLELREGRLMVGRFEVGAFYRDRGGVFYAVDEKLQPLSAAPIGELGLERDWFNAALDGTEDAVEEMVVGLATLIIHPIRSIEGLAQLPSAVGALIASSPDYFERYSALPLQEQIREAARLSTHLLTLYGSAAGAATRLSATAAKLPVLSLTAEGALAIEKVAVPTGAAAAALGTGAGAVYVLMAAENAPKESGKPKDVKGPGEWKRKKFSGSERSRRYQEQISGRSADEVYVIDGVEYDGFVSGILKEAKGERYLEFFQKNGQPKSWYKVSGRFQELIDQARNQSKAARGAPVEWHVAEREMVEILRSHFVEQRITGIKVIFTPPLPLP